MIVAAVQDIKIVTAKFSRSLGRMSPAVRLKLFYVQYGRRPLGPYVSADPLPSKTSEMS